MMISFKLPSLKIKFQHPLSKPKGHLLTHQPLAEFQPLREKFEFRITIRKAQMKFILFLPLKEN